MKLLIASDIHGAASWCEKLMDAVEAVHPDRVVLLGDLLYHGPRNVIPEDYAPKRVIEMLNSIAEHIIAVRGNCDAEVDQMVLDFPLMADYALLTDGDCSDRRMRHLLFTHGHVYGPKIEGCAGKLPGSGRQYMLVYGHTHIKRNEAPLDGSCKWEFNPGSVGLPKDGSHSYGIYENGMFFHELL